MSRVFQTEEEYECTRQAVEEFRLNEGPKAQAHLLKLYAANPSYFVLSHLYCFKRVHKMSITILAAAAI